MMANDKQRLIKTGGLVFLIVLSFYLYPHLSNFRLADFVVADIRILEETDVKNTESVVDFMDDLLSSRLSAPLRPGKDFYVEMRDKQHIRIGFYKFLSGKDRLINRTFFETFIEGFPRAANKRERFDIGLYLDDEKAFEGKIRSFGIKYPPSGQEKELIFALSDSEFKTVADSIQRGDKKRLSIYLDGTHIFNYSLSRVTLYPEDSEIGISFPASDPDLTEARRLEAVLKIGLHVPPMKIERIYNEKRLLFHEPREMIS